MPITWDKIVEMEPRLGQLQEEAASVDGSADHFCANNVWYRELKPRLTGMVGSESRSKHKELHTRDAYDIAYRRVYDSLPNCNDCACL